MSFSFLILIPFLATILSILFVFFINRDSFLLRSQYQNRLILLIGSAIVINVLGQLGYLGRPIVLEQLNGKGVTVPFHLISTIFIPTIIFAVCIRYAAKRLSGMGYNRFFSLFAVLPVFGPCFLFWLALTVRERVSVSSEDTHNVSSS